MTARVTLGLGLAAVVVAAMGASSGGTGATAFGPAGASVAPQQPTPEPTTTPAGPAPPPARLELSYVGTGFNNPIGIDYHEPSNRVVMSVNYPDGRPYNFELVDAAGVRERFSIAAGWSEEVKIATVRESDCTGGFTPGDLFTGTGRPGIVARIAADGGRVWSRWVQLPGEAGLMRGSLFQDRYCAMEGKLVVATTEGGVWLIDSDGGAKRLARLSLHLEGLTTVPDDPAKYGPWAGRVLAGAEGQNRIYAIDAAGDVDVWDLGIAPEDIDIVPPGEIFYGVEFAAGRLVSAAADQWLDKIGDVIIAQESGPLFDVRWIAADQAFQVTRIADVSQWEHVTFAKVALRIPTETATVTPPTTETPTPADTATRTEVPPPPTSTMTLTPPATPSPTATTVPGPIYLPALSARCERQHADVVLVLDASTSMLADDGGGVSKMAAARDAARTFLRLLRLPNDRAGIVWFNEVARTEQAITGDAAALMAALERIENREFTRIDLGLIEAQRALAESADAIRVPTLVLLTDGRSNPVPPAWAAAAAEASRAEGTAIYAIGLGPDVDVASLAAITGSPARLFLAPGSADLEAIYAQIAARLACAGPPP